MAWGADNQGPGGIASATSARHGFGLGIAISTRDANGSQLTAGSAGDGTGSLTHSVGNTINVSAAGNALGAGNPGAAPGGIAISVAVSGSYSVVVAGPGAVAVSAGGGFGSGAGAAVKISPGGGAPGSSATGNGGGSGLVNMTGPLTASASGNGDGSAHAETEPGGTSAATAASSLSLASVSTFGTGSPHIAGFVYDAVPAPDISVSLNLNNINAAITTTRTGEFGALYLEGSSAGNISANLNLAGDNSSINTGGAKAPGVFAALSGPGNSTMDFRLEGTGSAISTKGNGAGGVYGFASGGGNTAFDLTLNGDGSHVTTGGDNASGVTFLGAGLGTNTAKLSLGGLNSHIATRGDTAYGAFLLQNGPGNAGIDLTFSGTGSRITTAGDDAFGAYLFAQGAVDATANIEMSGENANITTSGQDAIGAYVVGSGSGVSGASDVHLTLSGSGSSINTAGDDAIGAFMAGIAPDTAVNFSLGGVRSQVSTRGVGAHGAFLYGAGSRARVDVDLKGAGSRISTAGANAFGAFVFAGNGAASAINFSLSGTDSSITTAGENAFGTTLLGLGTDANTIDLTLDGVRSKITTGGNGAVGVVLLANSNRNGAASVNLSGIDASIATNGIHAFGVYMSGSGTDSSFAVNLKGAGSTITTSGAGAPAVLIAAPNGRVSLGGRSRIATSGDGASGIVIEGLNSVIRLADGASVEVSGANAAAILLQPWTGNHDIFNAGSLSSVRSQAILGSNTSDTIINSGNLTGGGGTAFDLRDGADTLSLRSGSRISGAMKLGNGDNKVNMETGKDLSWIWSFEGNLPNGNINMEGGVPFVIARPGLGASAVSVASIEPTGFSAVDNAMISLAGSVNASVGDRFNGQRWGFAAPKGEVPGSTGAVWVKTFAGSSKQFAKQPTLENTHLFGGIVGGMDKMITPNFRFGVLAGTSSGRLDVKSGIQKIDSSTGFAGAYGQYDNNGYFLNTVVFGGFMQHGSTRLIANNLTPSGLETAKANYKGWFFAPEITIGKDLAISREETITPILHMRSLTAKFRSYRETGSAGNLTVNDRRFQSIEARLEISYSKKMALKSGRHLRATGRIGGFGRAMPGGNRVEATLLGRALSFTPRARKTLAGLYASAGVDYMTSGNTNFSASMDIAAASDKSISARIRAGFRVAF